MKMQTNTTRGTTHAMRLIGLMCATALVLSACSQADTERANQAAEVILTQSADATPATSTAPAATSSTDTATNTPLPPGVRITATPSLVYARCLARQATEMRSQPSDTATVVIALAARDIITAYGRTIDAGWVLGWRNDQAFGWAPAAGLGCTVPIAELMPTESNVLLLTPTGIAIAQVDATAVLTPTVASAATTVEATLASVSTATIQPSPETSPAPVTDTPMPTQLPTEVPILAPTEMQPLPPQTPFVMIQIVTVVVTVTVPVPVAPIEVTVIPSPASALTPSPTPAPMIVPTLASSPIPTPTTEAVAAQGLACEVTPGTPVNFRRGPSRTDRLIGTLRAGTPLIAQGRNDDGTWLYGLGPRSTSGWLIASSVVCNGDMTALPVVDR